LAPERKSWRVSLAGLAGFALGAATVLLIVWLYGGNLRGTPATPAASSASTPQAPGTLPAAPAPQISAPPVVPPATAPAVPPQAAAPPPGLARPPADLLQHNLLVPVQGIERTALQDTFDDARGQGRVHDAIDIMAPGNTPVVAVEAGRIAKLFTSKLGGLTIYQFDPTETFCYYYAHLDHYSPDLREGSQVARGQVIGYVGATGDASAEAPHLHFAITRLGADKKWWQGEALNPYPVLRQGR
jgi:murein DD-endopeptidase MepM/ murein hydrolase activator NlpD